LSVFTSTECDEATSEVIESAVPSIGVGEELDREKGATILEGTSRLRILLS
jgi:hypothetical protein